MTNRTELGDFDPNFFLVKESFREVVCESAGTTGAGVLFKKALRNTTALEVEGLLDDIGFGQYLVLPEHSPIPDNIKPAKPEIGAKYRERPMVVYDLLAKNGDGVSVPSQSLWLGTLSVGMPYLWVETGGIVHLATHSVAVEAEQSDGPAHVDVHLDLRIHHGPNFEQESSTVRVEPIEMGKLEDFSNLISYLRRKEENPS